MNYWKLESLKAPTKASRNFDPVRKLSFVLKMVHCFARKFKRFSPFKVYKRSLHRMSCDVKKLTVNLLKLFNSLLFIFFLSTLHWYVNILGAVNSTSPTHGAHEKCISRHWQLQCAAAAVSFVPFNQTIPTTLSTSTPQSNQNWLCLCPFPGGFCDSVCPCLPACCSASVFD